MGTAPETIWEWAEGRFRECPNVPLTDRGFRYGMSVFESLPVFGGLPQLLEPHLVRLREACELRNFSPVDDPLHAVAELLRRSERTGFARIYVTAGDGSATDAVTQSRFFVFLEDRPPPSRQEYRVGFCEEICHPLFGGLKTGNYWMNLEMWKQAQKAGQDEALLFNERSELISSCVANVFLISKGVLRTPACACGARAGVIRELVMERMKVEEGSLFVRDVLEAEEIFLTNSWIGVMPVAVVHGRHLPSMAVAERLRGELGVGAG